MSFPDIPTPWLSPSLRYRVVVVVSALIPVAVAGLLSIVATAASRLSGFEPAFLLPLVFLFFVLCLSIMAINRILAACSIRFQLEDDQILYRSGILSRTSVTLPYERIQTLTMHNGLVERMFGLTNLICQSAADQSTVSIPGLTESTASTLRQIILDRATSNKRQRGAQNL